MTSTSSANACQRAGSRRTDAAATAGNQRGQSVKPQVAVEPVPVHSQLSFLSPPPTLSEIITPGRVPHVRQLLANVG